MAYQPSSAYVLGKFLRFCTNNPGALEAVCKDWHQYMERTGYNWAYDLHMLTFTLECEAWSNQQHAKP